MFSLRFVSSSPVIVAYLLISTIPAQAALDGDVPLSSRPDVVVSLVDRTGSVAPAADCDGEAMILYDAQGRIIAIVPPDEAADC